MEIDHGVLEGNGHRRNGVFEEIHHHNGVLVGCEF
jgi:hypothetical protein